MNGSYLLQVEGLEVRFCSRDGEICAVSDFSCQVSEGETLALIGESGCGKSVAAHAIMRILPRSASIRGSVTLGDLSLFDLSEEDMNRVRGNLIAILFQSPDRSLNPLYRIERQISEPLHVHNLSANRHIVEQVLRQVGCNPSDIMEKYPCQCSGGMNQRALLAIVCGLNSRMLIVDEPTKGLDCCRVDDVRHSLERIRSEKRGILLISHDISFVQHLSDRIMVMYAGEVVESGTTLQVLSHPLHPYTRSLLMSLPEHGFVPIPGMAPALSNLPEGCRFSPRCSRSKDICHQHHPDLVPTQGREVRCHLH